MATGNSFNAMVARIARELGNRTDLIATVIPNAINDAIEIYQKERLRFNEMRPLTPYTLFTQPGSYIYTGFDPGAVSLLFQIDYINCLDGSTTFELSREVPESIYLATIAGTASGQPESWTFDGESIVIYPIPDQVYQLTVGGYLKFAGPIDLVNDTTNAWMNYAERLIRSRAKYEIALHVTRNAAMVSAMSPDEPPPGQQGGACWRYLNEMKGEANKIRGRSRIRAMQF